MRYGHGDTHSSGIAADIGRRGSIGYHPPQMKSASGQTTRLIPRMRVLCGEEVALGPGKADLLGWISKTRSIREAARKMDMSYMRAWQLIKAMNACFREPVVIAS